MMGRGTKAGGGAVVTAAEVGEPALATAGRVAEILSVSTRTVWRLAAAGKLRVVRIGASARFDLASVREFVAAGGTDALAATEGGAAR